MTTAQTWALSLSERLKRDCEMNWPDYDNQMAASVELSRLAAVEAELAAAKAQVEALSTLSVTNIMLDVVPGDDGEGCEVFAKSVAEVEEALGRLGLEVEDWRCGIKRLQPSLTRPAVPEGWEQVEAIAVARYKVAASDQSMFHRHAVVAGDGKQQLYLGREVECEIMARKFANAFLDGAFVAQGLLAAPRPEAYAPLTPEEVRDLTCMHSGAPWSDAHLAALGEVIVVYEQLRREGNRPVDPATLPEASGCVSTFQESETQAVLSAEKSTPPTGLMTMAIKALTNGARRS